MRTPASILVIAMGDGRDQAAIELASRLAARSGARLVAASVLSELPRAFQRLSLVIDPVELWTMAAREHACYLETLVGGQARNTKAETRVLFGEPVEQMLREVSRENYGLVIVPGSRWCRHLPGWLRFDLPARLARRCPCQVRIAKSHNRDRAWRALGLESVMAR